MKIAVHEPKIYFAKDILSHFAPVSQFAPGCAIYRFYGQEKLVDWLIKKIEAVKKKLECKVSKCLK